MNLEDIGNSELSARKYKIAVSGTITSTDGQKYGRDWKFGDRVFYDAFGYSGTAIVSSAVLSMSNGVTTVQGQLSYE